MIPVPFAPIGRETLRGFLTSCAPFRTEGRFFAAEFKNICLTGRGVVKYSCYADTPLRGGRGDNYDTQ